MKLHAVVRIVLLALMLVVAFVAGQHSSRSVAAQSRPKWEYKIVGSIHTVDQINKLGEDGWEAVTLNASNRVLLRRSK
jgi:disulfide bond formation protein DsbB